MSNLQTATASTSEVAELSLLDSIVEQSRIARNDEQHGRTKSLIGGLAREVMAVTIVVS